MTHARSTTFRLTLPGVTTDAIAQPSSAAPTEQLAVDRLEASLNAPLTVRRRAGCASAIDPMFNAGALLGWRVAR